MSDFVLRRARDLPAPVKAAVESLLGRSLQDDEQVSVRAFSRHEAPRRQARAQAARHLKEQLNKIAEKVKNVSEEEMEAAINEAMDHVRPRRP